MLVDSSVWIGYLRGDNHIEVQHLISALERGQPVWLAPPILQEVLQGADNPDRFKRWDRVLGELPMIIAPDGREAARSAAHLYAQCRWAGVTPRSANDCLIAIHAILGGIPLLHRDQDFGLIASVEPRLVIVVPTKEARPTDGSTQLLCPMTTGSSISPATSPQGAPLPLPLRRGGE